MYTVSMSALPVAAGNDILLHMPPGDEVGQIEWYHLSVLLATDECIYKIQCFLANVTL